MKILAIETSCDETAITIMEASGDLRNASLVVLGNALYSQAKKHAAFGGVYPSLAKREHAANLVPLCELALKEAGMYERTSAALTPEGTHFVEEVLVREPGLGAACVRMLGSVARPDIDAIAVTQGPGLEPALWVGINFARALAHAWELPIIPVNHLEGHMLASVVSGAGTTDQPFVLDDVPFPLLGLILSGGHTEFVFAEAWGAYEIIGSTRDDSIGEAFDKVARLLGLPYPGGPEISRVAARARPSMYKGEVLPGVQLSPLPRPMIHSGDLDFSFSGLKTAVKYQVRDLGDISDLVRDRIAAEFEHAVTDVVVAKTRQALEEHPVRAFVLGGGVSANRHIRDSLETLFSTMDDAPTLLLPAPGLSTDNAVMIGMAGYVAHCRGVAPCTATDELRASGDMAL